MSKLLVLLPAILWGVVAVTSPAFAQEPLPSLPPVATSPAFAQEPLQSLPPVACVRAGAASGRRRRETSPAFAQEPLPPLPPVVVQPAPVAERGPSGTWYGWQTLALDAIPFVTVAFAVGDNVLSRGSALGGNAELALVLGSAAFFIASGPAVHGFHGQSGAALRSFGLRIGLAAGGAAAGALLGGVAFLAGGCFSFSGSPSGCNAVFPVVFGASAIGGVLAASIVDATWLAREPVARARPSTSWQMAPLVLRGGAGLSVAGTF